MARQRVLSTPISFNLVRILYATDVPIERSCRAEYETGRLDEQGNWIKAPDSYCGIVSYTGAEYAALSELGSLSDIYDFIYADLETRGLIGAGWEESYGPSSSSSSV
jgi:hypothetical protein